MSNTFNFRFHVRQERLLVITLWQLLLSFFYFVKSLSYSVLPVIFDHRLKTRAPKT